MSNWAERIISFNKNLEYKGSLPEGIRIMNPFKESPLAVAASSEFYRKYYSDNKPRQLILGINPGRFGSGQTGISFTDPKRLKANCHIDFAGPLSHEPSSAYIYEMIDAFGGEEKFYQQFYIHSICPLGFTKIGEKGKETNYNYYDQPALLKSVYPFIVENIRKQIEMGFETGLCFCFGTGKNETFFRKLNEAHHFFKRIVALEHPRYIMQYKSKEKSVYIDKYLRAFSEF